MIEPKSEEVLSEKLDWRNICADALQAELRRMDWAKELSQETIDDFIKAVEAEEHAVDHVLIDYNQDLHHVYFLVYGKVRIDLTDRLGKDVFRGQMGRGTAVGLLAIASSERSHLKAVTLEPTALVKLNLPQLLSLCSKHQDFQFAILRLASGVLRHVVMVDRQIKKPSVVAIVHQSPATRTLTAKIVGRLERLHENPCIAGDEQTQRPDSNVPFKFLAENGRIISYRERFAVLREWSAMGRLVLDVNSKIPVDDLIATLGYADTILWCVEGTDAQEATAILCRLEERVPWVRDKICVVWLLSHTAPHPPYIPRLEELVVRDFKLAIDEPVANQGALLVRGLERVIHHLRGLKIGLALGGGAARGMAHLGVLKALEAEGIDVDMIAGTSAGAMTGLVYASGLEAGYATECFKRDLMPSWIFRQLPGGGYWYLLHKYRTNQFDAMLRRYLERLHVRQLAIPTATVGVDLVDGSVRARHTGDATNNILESINLPPLALPIVRGEEAIVDGGLLNNVPADVLVSSGCNFVIACSVTAKLEKEFMNLKASGKLKRSRWFSTMQVIMRQNMIQSYSMNAVGVRPADFVINPDVTAFDISEFTRADEMASIGEATARESFPSLRTLLHRLDSELFQA